MSRAAEAPDYPSSHFDIIVGIDILHHVEVASAAAECLRVLKPDGIAIFKEPVAVPVFDRLRNSRLGCAIRPKDVPFDLHITEDERKLTPDDLRLIGAMWSVEEYRFRLLTRLDALIGERFKTAGGRVKAGNRRRPADARVADAASPWRQRRASVPAPLMCKGRSQRREVENRSRD